MSTKTSSRLRPCFQKESPDGFYASLRKKAAETIQQNQSSARRVTWMKAIIYPALYLTAYILLLIKGSNLLYFYLCYSCMGLLTTLIIFNIVHDAIHHSLFEKPAMNKSAAYFLDLLGGNSFVWSKRHVTLHHSFTNIPGWDVDIQSNICRFNEQQHYRKGYQFQVFYMPFLYLLYSLNWILIRDFRDFFQRSSPIKRYSKIPRIEYIKMFVFKIFHATYILAVPAFILPHTGFIFASGFLLMHGLMSALTLLVLLPSHLDEDAHFPEPDQNMMLSDSWAIHQLKVTNDFGTRNVILNFIMGGLNHHIAHHLFPNVNHNIIPGITRLIYETADEQNLQYKCFSLKEVMMSHVKLLKKNGQLQHFLEE
jgi:linoleoyl-CoA desaturase